ncbi:hypothetical protein [Solidesulfovibrio alcoholivorans]|uniref:hypothetical protein n=1 Tax=Solidesulfovibrio alcoholivorans TaxID=81406 RepID=UPI0012EBABD3|nr:hypothetical protein [Solidesulfovibrio alcoholivorans]
MNCMLIFFIILLSPVGLYAETKSNWNIAGIRLGEEPTKVEAAIQKEFPNFKYKKSVHSFQHKGFRLPEIYLGYDAYNPVGDYDRSDYIQTFFSVQDPTILISIARHMNFTIEKNLPTFSAIKTSLIEKYGQWQLEYKWGHVLYLYWFDGTPEKYRNENFLKKRLSPDRASLSSIHEGVVDYCGGLEKNLGIVMRAELTLDQNNFVVFMNYELTNYPEAWKSCSDVWEMLNTGINNKLQEDSSNGDLVKPKL